MNILKEILAITTMDGNPEDLLAQVQGLAAKAVKVQNRDLKTLQTSDGLFYIPDQKTNSLWWSIFRTQEDAEKAWLLHLRTMDLIEDLITELEPDGISDGLQKQIDEVCG